MSRASLACAVCLVVAAQPVLNVRAEDAETRALRQEIEALRKRVEALETQAAGGRPSAVAPVPQGGESPAPLTGTPERPSPQGGAAPAASAPVIGAQQGQSRPPAPVPAQAAAAAANPSPGPATSPVIALRETWGRVTKNMSETQVLALLGEPSNKTEIDGKRVWYYYYAGIGGASVFFKANGRVSSYQAPNIGWW
jgi:hypothetical protein